MDISLFIAGRIAKKQQRSFSRFIIRLSIIATALSVATMILSLAFVNGFQKVISQKIFSFWGHIRVQQYAPYKVNIAEEMPIDRNDSIEHYIQNLPFVSDIQPFATKSAILQAKGSIEGVLFKGVTPDYRFDALSGFLKKGRWLLQNDSSRRNEVVLSEVIARQLELNVGDDLLVYFIRPGDVHPRTRKLRVCGLFRTGIDIYDKTFAYGDLSLIARLNDWNEHQIGGYEVVLKDDEDMAFASNMIFGSLPQGWDSKTLTEIHPEIFDWLYLQNTNKYILLTVMTLVAAINLISCLIIMILERTRMIGVLKSLGMSDWGIQKIFLGQGAWIMAWGIGLGTLLGTGVCWLQAKTGFIKLNEEAYYIDRAPVDISSWEVFAIMSGTFFICLCIMLIPSIISRRIRPVKAVQFR